MEDDPVSPDERLNDLFVAYGESGSNELSIEIESNVRELVVAATGVPVQVNERGSGNAMDYARVVRNIVEEDPDAPTLTEVREMMDEAVTESDQT